MQEKLEQVRLKKEEEEKLEVHTYTRIRYRRRVPQFLPVVSLQFSCCDLSVREKDWHSRARGTKVT